VVIVKKNIHTYNAHETNRMQDVHGATLASFKDRSFAFGIDFILAFLIFLIAFIISEYFGLLDKLGFETDAKLEFNLTNWYSLIFVVIYFCLSTYWGNGKTVGKKIFGIRVVSLVHDKMSLWHLFERALGYGASALEGGFGFIQYFIHANKRTVHDRIAETIVVKEKKIIRKEKAKSKNEE
jgi:uncharacterized RDD family membrane protein YckC